MSGYDVWNFGLPDPEVSARARRAFLEAQKLLPGWLAFARMLAGNPNLKMRLHPSGSFTDGDVIYVRVPIELGDNLKHDPTFCGVRGSDLIQRCEACAVEESIDTTVIHEIAHCVFESFEAIDEVERREIVGRTIALECQGAEGTRAAKIRKRIEANLDSAPNYIALASLVSPFLPLLYNAAEDTRVNAKMWKARPGTRVMFGAQTNRIFVNGVQRADGSVMLWKEQPSNAQAMIGVYCVGSDLDYSDWLDAKVVADLQDDEVQSICLQIKEARSTRSIYRLMFPLLEALRRLGYFKSETDDEDDPGQGEPCEQGEPEQGESEESGEQQGEPGSSPGGESQDDGDDNDDEQDGEQGPSADSESSDEQDDSETSSGESESEGNESPEDDSEPGKDGSSDGDEGDDEAEGDDNEGLGSTGADADKPDDNDDPFDGADGESWGDEGEEQQDSPESDEEADGTDAEGNAGNLDGAMDAPDDTDTTDAEAGDSNLEPGTPDEVMEAFKLFGRHEDESPKTEIEEEQEQAMEVAIVQANDFDHPSDNVVGVQVNTMDDEELHNNFRKGWDVEPAPETILAPSLLALRTVFADNKKSKVERNRDSGPRLDRRVGRKLVTGDNRVFTKRSRPGKKNYFVLIGLDVSGSTQSGAIRLIKSAGRAQADLLDRLGVRFCVYGHTGDGWVQIFKVKGPDEPWDKKAKDALDALGGGNCNLDGHTLEYYRKVAQAQRETDKLIMYYTDGAMPAANRAEELEILQENIEICRRSRIDLVGVGIHTDSPSGHGLDTIQIDSIEDVPKVVEGLRQRLT